MNSQVITVRDVVEVRQARPAMDGDGVKIVRISGMRHAGMDPILMLDELRSEQREDVAGGFPPHPHRGMQTLTYMRRGGIVHEDSEGNRGEIRGGGAQWMSAGGGIIHSEMPTPDSDGFHGFQLWVNLPAARKMEAPRYRDIPADALARVSGAGERWPVQAGGEGARLVVLRGWPLREPVANYGPFVMNTEEEIQETIRQYQRGKLVGKNGGLLS